MMLLMLWVVGPLLLVVWLLAWDSASRNYWRSRGVYQLDPSSLLAPRDFLGSFTLGLPKVARLYRSCEAPLLGLYKGRTPVLMVRDPRLVIAVLRADFHHFADKRPSIAIDTGHDPLSQHLLGLTGERWKSVRSKLTPVFSSGKIKEALPLIEEALVGFTAGLGRGPVSIYPASVTLVSDVILSYAFGLEAASAERARVRAMGLRAVRSGPTTALLRAARFHFPRLFGLLRLRAFDPAVTAFFTGFVRSALARRAALPPRAHFLDRLLALATHLPEEEREGLLAAQVFSFFVAGFETTCFTLSCCLYELCKSPQSVKKAREQLKLIIQKHGILNYEAIKEASYIKQIIKESLRLYPTDFVTARICTKTYTFKELGVVVEKGTELLIPGFGLSRDEKYFPQPTVFDPDRFSSERKDEIVPGSYLPFGEGPRQCIAVRFSKLELEYIVAKLISEYDMELGPGTPKDLEFEEYSRVTHFKGNILINFKKL